MSGLSCLDDRRQNQNVGDVDATDLMAIESSHVTLVCGSPCRKLLLSVVSHLSVSVSSASDFLKKKESRRDF